MKALVTHLLCFSLMTFQVGLIPTAYAEENSVKTEDVANDSRESGDEAIEEAKKKSKTDQERRQDNQDTVTANDACTKNGGKRAKDGSCTMTTTNANVVETDDAYVHKDGEQKDAKGNLATWSANMLIFAIVFVAPMVIMSCSKKISGWLFMATAAYYLFSEIQNWKSYATKTDREMKIYKGQDEEKQVSAVQAAANQSDAAAQSAEKRAQLFRNAGIGFSLASAAAFIEAFLATPKPRAGIDSCPNPAPHCCEMPDQDPAPACTLGRCGRNVAGSGHYKRELFPSLEGDKAFAYMINRNPKKLAIYLAGQETDDQAMMTYREWSRMSEGAIKSSTINDYNMIKPLLLNKKRPWMKNAFMGLATVMSKITLPQVFAEGTRGGDGKATEESKKKTLLGVGLMGAGVAALAYFSKPVGKFMTTALDNGYVRGAVFAAFAGMAFLASKATGDAADTLKNNAKMYRDLAATMKSKYQGIGGSANAALTIDNGDLNTVEAKNKMNKEVGVCGVGKPGEFARRDSQCECRKDNTCKKAEVPKVDFAGVDNEGAISEGAANFANSANSLYNGDVVGAATQGNQLSQSAAKINRLRTNIQQLANKNLVDQGKKPIDFDRLEAQSAEQLKRAVAQTFNELSSKEKDALLAVAPKLLPTELNEKAPKEEKYKKPSYAQGVVKLNSKAKTKKQQDWEMNLEFQDGNAAPAEGENAANAGVDELAAVAAMNSEDQDYSHLDSIEKDRKKSLWKLITKRYIRTAYPFFFDAGN